MDIENKIFIENDILDEVKNFEKMLNDLCPKTSFTIEKENKTGCNFLVLENKGHLDYSNNQENLFISTLSDEENIDLLLKDSGLNHIIGKNTNILETQLVANICRYLHPSKGIKDYLHNKNNIQTRTLTNSKETTNTVEELINSFEYDSYFDSPKEYLRTMANELLTNAFYNAYQDKDGSFPYQNQDRKTPVNLDKDGAIEISLALDEERVVLCVTDPFGTLTRESVLNNIKRGIKTKKHSNKEGGAGLGLYLIYSYANHLVFNLDKNNKTEIVAIIENNRRLKKYKEIIKSIHFYTGG